MGLDMYVMAIKKNGKPFKECVEDFNALDYETWKEQRLELAYWRKANQIHKWFVDNIQNGNDDCENHELTKDIITQILDICKQVKVVFDSATKTKGKVKNGQRWTANGWEDVLKDGNVFVGLDFAQIKELLPTEDGFFFGSTEYDEYYYEDIISTITQLEKTLEYDFDEYYIYYSSSW